jgi:hypothetical protein
MWNMEQGTSDREWSYKRKPPVERITFSWTAELDRPTTLYFLHARCDINNKKAKNRVSFKSVQLRGVLSGNTVRAANVSAAIKRGEGKAALWDLTPFIGELLTDETVLISGEVTASKQLHAYQAMTCALSVWELFDTNDLRLRSKSERLSFFEEFVETMERARGLPVVLRTGQTRAFANGDDGDLRMGVSWPKPRFTDNGDGTVTDNLTRLIWLRDANCPEGTLPWADALAWSGALFDGCATCGGTEGDCGLSDGSVAGDWRLPNRFELESLLDLAFWDPALSNAAGTGQWVEGDAFYRVQSFDPNTGRASYYWSSTTLAMETKQAWFVDTYQADAWIAWKWSDWRVWPVRGGQ